MTEQATPIPALPDRRLAIGGRDYTLRLSWLALGFLQELWQLSDLDAVLAHAEAKSADIQTMTDFAWAAFQSYHPEVPRETVFLILDAMGLKGTQRLIEELGASAAMEVEEHRPQARRGVRSLFRFMG